MRRTPSAYALLLLTLVPFSALVCLLTILLGALLGRDGSVAAGVFGALVLLGSFAVRVLWYRRHTRVEFRRNDKGLAAVAADGGEVVRPWRSTAVRTDGLNRYKLSNAGGTVVTLGSAERAPVVGGERISGLRTRTATGSPSSPPSRSPAPSTPSTWATTRPCSWSRSTSAAWRRTAR
ncbi:hypothetical protein ABZ154_12235 [Streptomyces sp. NPDC006261]|uniref:hypothetical protein n=1 Tax=Streptomyces sp. NPDC006261 TaxID=3156739 RepID=UPI0033AEDA16